ncbi:fimbrial protein [Alishewanella longhuensis]
MLREARRSELLTEPYLEFIEAGRERASLLSDFKMHLKISGYEALEQATTAPPASIQGGR